MEFTQEDLKQEILYWSKRLYEKGMSPATSGNVSIRTDKGIFVSASGVCLNDMNEDDIILIDYDGNILDGHKKPTSEKIMHSEIYTRRDDINAIIHCHCPVITAFCVAGLPINKPILPDFALMFDEIPLIPYFCPSTFELATKVADEFDKDHNVVLLQNHGVVFGADSLKNAFYGLEGLRAYVETYFGAEVLGGAKPLNKKSISQIRKLFLKN